MEEGSGVSGFDWGFGGLELVQLVGLGLVFRVFFRGLWGIVGLGLQAVISCPGDSVRGCEPCFC